MIFMVLQFTFSVVACGAHLTKHRVSPHLEKGDPFCDRYHQRHSKPRLQSFHRKSWMLMRGALFMFAEVANEKEWPSASVSLAGNLGSDSS